MAELLDNCRFAAGSSGTADFADGTSVAGCRNLDDAGAVNGAVYPYKAQNATATQWERGYGTYDAGAGTLSRDDVRDSSDGGAKVDFSTNPEIIISPGPDDLIGVQELMGLVTPTAAAESGGNITLDVEDGNELFFTHTMASDEMLLAPANMPIGSTISLLIDPTDVPGTAPSIVTTSKGTLASGTSHSITLPSGTSPGDTVVVLIAMDGAPVIAVDTGVSGINWRHMGQDANGTTVTSAMLWKIAEGSDVLTVTTTATEEGTFYCYRISGGHVLGDVSATTANGSSTNGDPPLLTMPSGEQNYLLITALATDAQVVASGAPSGYSNLDTQQAASSGGASISVADRTASVSSEDPGTFTNTSEQWVTWTVAVGPSRNYTLSFDDDFAEPLPFITAESLVDIRKIGSDRYAAQVSWSAA